jgi:hypothetical protein
MRSSGTRRGDSPDLTIPAGPLQNSSWQKLISPQPFGYLRASALAGCVFRLPWWPLVTAIGDMFSSLSFNQRTRRFRNERNHAGKPAVVPEGSMPSRRTNAAGSSVGILLFPVSVGLIAGAIIGVFFGIGFWLLASPARQTISDSGQEALLGETETPRSAAVNVIPGSPLAQRSAVADAVPPQQNNITQELSAASPNGEAPVETASVPQPVSSAAVPPAGLMPLASPPAVTAAEGALSAGTRGPSARDRGAHARTASRHPHPRSDRSAPILTPP